MQKREYFYVNVLTVIISIITHQKNDFLRYLVDPKKRLAKI